MKAFSERRAVEVRAKANQNQVFQVATSVGAEKLRCFSFKDKQVMSFCMWEKGHFTFLSLNRWQQLLLRNGADDCLMEIFFWCQNMPSMQ